MGKFEKCLHCFLLFTQRMRISFVSTTTTTAILRCKKWRWFCMQSLWQWYVMMRIRIMCLTLLMQLILNIMIVLVLPLYILFIFALILWLLGTMFTTCFMQFGCHELKLQDNIVVCRLMYNLFILLVLLSYWSVSSVVVTCVSTCFVLKVNKGVVVVIVLRCSKVVLFAWFVYISVDKRKAVTW